MINFLYISFGCCFILCSIFLSVRCLDWFLEKRKNKFASQKEEFLCDLLLVQNKWLSKGKFEYSDACGMVIEAFYKTQEGGDKKPMTAEGRRIQEAQKAWLVENITKGVLDEVNNLNTEI